MCGKSYNKAEGVYIYTDALGNRIKPDYLSGEFPKFLEKNGFRRMRYHDLRHTNASLLIGQGVDGATVSKRLGHANVAITLKTYTHAIKEHDREAADEKQKITTKIIKENC